jgi:hypothetical protein
MAGRTVRPEFEGTAAQKESCSKSGRTFCRRLPEARPVHRKTPRWRAERRRIFPKGRCAIDYLTRLLGAPSPRILRGQRKTGLPRAATKNRGGNALAVLHLNQRDEASTHLSLSSRATERSEGDPGPILRSLSRGHRVWVPAFAGTTADRLRVTAARTPRRNNQNPSEICCALQPLPRSA